MTISYDSYHQEITQMTMIFFTYFFFQIYFFPTRSKHCLFFFFLFYFVLFLFEWKFRLKFWSTFNICCIKDKNDPTNVIMTSDRMRLTNEKKTTSNTRNCTFEQNPSGLIHYCHCLMLSELHQHST